LADRRGDIIIMFALLLPILVGVVGLGVEVGSWYFAKRNLQSAADAAAVAALFEVRSGSSDALIETKAKEEATANGWDETAGDTLVVRRHINWNNHRPDLKEDLAHLVQDIKRRICGIASAGVPLFSV
jgi:Flp pilus assembly protein TadG